MAILKFIIIGGLLLVVIAMALLSPWNLYLAEGWAHCSECHSTAFRSGWVLGNPYVGNPYGGIVWAQEPEYRVDSPRRAQKIYFDSNHEHDWKFDNHWFRRFRFMAPSLFVTEPDLRNEFAIRYNKDQSFGDWVDLQVEEGRSDPDEIREIFHTRAIDLKNEPSTGEDRAAQRAWRLFQAYKSESNESAQPNRA